MNIIETIKLLKQDESRLMDTTLQFIRAEQNGLLKDVAKIHLISAEQAFVSATRSNDPETEARIGIGHLRDSFNAFQLYLEKGFRGPWGLYYLKWRAEPRTDIQLKLASLAFVIAIIYERLQDESNYILWKNTGFNFAKSYINDRANAIQWWQNAPVLHSINEGLNSAHFLDLRFVELFSQTIKEV